MLAMLLEDDQHSREVLSRMLNHLGFSRVVTASSIDEAAYYFKLERDKIRLIVSSESSSDSPDLPLSRLIIQNRDLDLTPFLLLTDNWRTHRLAPFRNRLSRIDAIVSRPFGIEQLKRGFYEASRRRATLRSTLLLLGKSTESELSNEVYSGSELFHWKKLVSATSLQELIEKKAEIQFYLGAILIEPAFVTTAVADWVAQFKKTLIGAQTPVVFLGRDPDSIGELRVLADFFWNPIEELSESLGALSNRVRFHSQIRDSLAEIRELIRQNKTLEAKRLVTKAQAVDSKRWELFEVAGSIALQEGNLSEARHFFESALLYQPCSPSIYLQLFKTLDEAEFIFWSKRAKQFCPRHPQINNPQLDNDGST